MSRSRTGRPRERTARSAKVVGPMRRSPGPGAPGPMSEWRTRPVRLARSAARPPARGRGGPAPRTGAGSGGPLRERPQVPPLDRGGHQVGEDVGGAGEGGDPEGREGGGVVVV